MQSVLSTLEFDRICAALGHEALTPLGRDRVLDLAPAAEFAEVQRQLDLTTEAVAFSRRSGSLAISAPDDLLSILGTLGIEDQPLDPAGLLGLARFVDSVGAVVTGIRPHGVLLASITASAASFETEAQAIRRAIHPSGDVNDDASPTLRELRDKLRRQRARLRSTLEGLTRGRDTAKYLQDQIVTDRSGRYVIVLRSEHRDAIPGIVHGSSVSGASLFVEPLQTVELNNEIVSLAEREREEVHRILLALTDAFRRRRDDMDAIVDVAGRIDELYAKVQLAGRVDGIAPVLSRDAGLDFRGARHPLLIPALRQLLRDRAPHDEDAEREADGPAVVVTTDLTVAPPTYALVISGPNTGGKTVALKAVGLLALMAQAGVLIPVEAGSRFTPFRSLFADIGDEQSISASLSTFSAHVANIVAMERALELPALVLLDEVGGGTDRAEGGALGIAVIDHFRQRGATVVATTHDDALKTYAATTPGVATAAFGFNPDTYAPTYKLIDGAPGRSLALEIAERLGMPDSVIVDARARRSSRESQLAEHLARLDRELASVDAERARMAGERQAMAADRQALLDREARLTEREAVLKRRMDDRLNARLREAREEVDKIVADLKGRAGSLVQAAERRTAPTLSTGDIGGLRASARAALESVAGRLDADAPASEGSNDALAGVPSVGDEVFVPLFGAAGLVRSVSGKQIEVEVRGKRMKVGLKDLTRANGTAAARVAASASPPRGRSSPDVASMAPARDLVLIGSTVDEATDRLEKFLDAALLADERRLRIVHGHGTGRLRDAIRRQLRTHPLVATVVAAADHEGGDAATIVELKD